MVAYKQDNAMVAKYPPQVATATKHPQGTVMTHSAAKHLPEQRPTTATAAKHPPTKKTPTAVKHPQREWP